MKTYQANYTQGIKYQVKDYSTSNYNTTMYDDINPMHKSAKHGVEIFLPVNNWRIENWENYARNKPACLNVISNIWH